MIEQQNMAVVPAARIADLVITEAADEVLVYDKKRHQIHHLNHTSAVIWRLCDGSRTVQELTKAARVQLGGDVDSSIIELAMANLAEANLFTQPVAGSSIRNVSYSRRKMLRRAAVAGAIAVPAIVSMTAPTAAQTASCLFTQTCTNKNTGAFCCLDCGGGILSAGVCTHITGTLYACVAACV